MCNTGNTINKQIINEKPGVPFDFVGSVSVVAEEVEVEVVEVGVGVGVASSDTSVSIKGLTMYRIFPSGDQFSMR